MSHLTHNQRLLIENGLRNGKSFKEISVQIGKSHTTVSREVLRHRVDSDKGAFGRLTNRCVHARDCERILVCGDATCTRRLCRACAKCNGACPFFEEKVCERFRTPPYVCNGCRDEHKCVLRKKYYIHDTADKAYKALLSGAREGAALTEAERSRMGGVLAAGLAKGQSVHHVMAANNGEFTCCEKTVYRYINSRLLPGATRGALPMAVKMRPRRKKGVERKLDRRCRDGRTMEDFRAFVEANPDTPVVEIDTVEGCRGSSKVLLTMNFDNCGLLLAFLREANTARSVADVFDRLEETLGAQMFRRMFPLCLTDNGSEFTDPSAIETSPLTGGRRTRLFYCDPHASWQKGRVENNHLNLRKIFTKGCSFDPFTQEDVDLAVSNVNSMARRSLNDIPAFTVFESLYGKGVLGRLGIRLVPPGEVNLTPGLLGG